MVTYTLSETHQLTDKLKKEKVYKNNQVLIKTYIFAQQTSNTQWLVTVDDPMKISARFRIIFR